MHFRCSIPWVLRAAWDVKGSPSQCAGTFCITAASFCSIIAGRVVPEIREHVCQSSQLRLWIVCHPRRSDCAKPASFPEAQHWTRARTSLSSFRPFSLTEAGIRFLASRLPCQKLDSGSRGRKNCGHHVRLFHVDEGARDVRNSNCFRRWRSVTFHNRVRPTASGPRSRSQ